jgi:hypothetical protein
MSVTQSKWLLTGSLSAIKWVLNPPIIQLAPTARDAGRGTERAMADFGGRA